MSKASVVIAYDGEALKDHSMDVRELAFALTGLSELFSEANKLVNGDKAVTQVDIKAKFDEGSFDIVLDVINKSHGFLNCLANNSEIQGANCLLSILGFAGITPIGLFQLIKWLKNREIKKQERLPENKIKIFVEDENGQLESIDINSRVLELFRNSKAVKGLEKAVSPLEKEGYESFDIKNRVNKNELINIDRILKNDLSYFKITEIERNLTEFENIMYLNLVSPCFEEGNKWKFSTKDGKIFASIKDENFLEEVNSSRKLFGKGDILKVRILTKQTELPDFQIKNEYDILEVVEHKRYDQLNLF